MKICQQRLIASSYAIFCMCYLLFMTKIGYAQVGATEVDYQHDVLSIFNPDAIVYGTDASIQLLGYIFGTVDGVLFGFGSHLVGTMFGIFNAAVLGLGGLVIVYTIVVATLNTAQEGEFLGRKWNSLWIPVRTALATALLIPKASGYSMIQIFVMWIVLQGVGAADTMWNNVVTYLTQAGTLMPTVYGKAQLKPIAERAEQVLKLQICLAGLEKFYNDTWANGKHASSSPPVSLFPSYPVLEGDTYRIYFPGKNSIPSINPHNLAMGDCGSISFAKNTDALIDVAQMDASWQMVLDLQDQASQIVQGTNSDTALIVQSMQNATLDFIGVLDPAVRRLNDNNVADGLAILNESTDDGWILAGRYYHIIAANSSATQNVATTFVPTVTISTSPSKALQAYQWTTLNSWMSQIDDSIVDTTLASLTSGATITKEEESPHLYDFNYDFSQNKNPIPEWHSGIPIVPNIINGIIYALNQLIDVFFDFLNTLEHLTVGMTFSETPQTFNDLFKSANRSDPIAAVMNLGTAMIDNAGDAWLSITITIAVLAGSSAIFASISGAVGALQVVITWLVPLITTIVTLLFTAGAVLAYYVPLVPYMLFFFGGLGWMFAVIESMIAAPIVALGIMHPEGHEHYGKAEPAVMLLTNIFLRPTLMILGLMFGIIMSFVAIKLLNLGFVQTAKTLVAASNHSVMHISSLIKGAAIVIIYVMMIVLIINKTFGLIHEVPNSILRWLSGGDQRPLGSDSANIGEIQSVVSAGAGSGIRGGLESGQAASKDVMSGIDQLKKSGSGGASGSGSGGMDLNT